MYFSNNDDEDEEIDIFSEIENNNSYTDNHNSNNFVFYSNDEDIYIDFESDLENNPYIRIEDHPQKGRCVYSKCFIPRGTTLLKDIPYVSIVNSKYKKNICNSCFQYFNESNRQNVSKCPGCGEIYYCSTFCKHSRFKETKHSELECKWIYYFSKTYQQQLLEDEKDLVLIVLRILARRQQSKQSVDFTKQPITDRLHLPSNIIDLVDHIDEYFSVALDSFNNHNSNNNNNDSNDNKDNLFTVKNEIIYNKNISIKEPVNIDSDDFRLNWQHDFSKLLTLSRIIQNVITPSKNLTFKSSIDEDGDYEMTDRFSTPSSLRTSLEVITKTDYNLLKLLCKIRSNYFGLWTHSGILENNNNSSNQQQHYDSSEIDNNGDDNDKQQAKRDANKQRQCHWGGAAVYLRLSLFNHSCFPNCTTLLQTNDSRRINIGNGYGASGFPDNDPDRINPLTFHIVTLRDIEPDSECLITYIPLDQKVKDRMSHLKSMWLFDCNCFRCSSELADHENEKQQFKFEDFCCPNLDCHSGMLVPDSPGSQHGTCRECELSYLLP